MERARTPTAEFGRIKSAMIEELERQFHWEAPGLAYFDKRPPGRDPSLATVDGDVNIDAVVWAIVDRLNRKAETAI